MNQKSPFAHLTKEDIAEIEKEFDRIHEEVFNDLGERDRNYILSVIAAQRQLAVAGRVLLLGSLNKTSWIAGTVCLGTAKILENMEIGHNVMHGQWDWMNDPSIHSSTWDWDTASTAQAWKHSHNYIHHTYTNIVGKDIDLGYEIMRIDPKQPWHPRYLMQPFYNVALMILFEWGVAIHDMEIEKIFRREKPWSEVWDELKGISGKARAQIVKDYIGWPLMSAIATGAAQAVSRGRLVRSRTSPIRNVLPTEPRHPALNAIVGTVDAVLPAAKKAFISTLVADAVANLIRNVWSNAIIFCGHFPDQTYTFTEEETENETRGEWYLRQLVGAANIEGTPFFHVMSGNLGYQVEHHLYPDMPSTRYSEIAPKVKEICERYRLPYNTGRFSKQWLTVQRTILRLAFPGGKPRPKPGAYTRTKEKVAADRLSEAARYRARMPEASASAS